MHEFKKKFLGQNVMNYIKDKDFESESGSPNKWELSRVSQKPIS